MKLENFLKLIFGIFLIVAGLYILAGWWWRDFLVILKGFIPVFLVLVGVIFLLLGFEK